MTADWIPDYQPHKWEKEKAQFASWSDGKRVLAPWKRARFFRWSREQHLFHIDTAQAAKRKLRKDRLANPSPELIAAYRELRAAEDEFGGRLGCARGTDMSDPQQVLALAHLLRELPNPSKDLPVTAEPPL